VVFKRKLVGGGSRFFFEERRVEKTNSVLTRSQNILQTVAVVVAVPSSNVYMSSSMASNSQLPNMFNTLLTVGGFKLRGCTQIGCLAILI